MKTEKPKEQPKGLHHHIRKHKDKIVFWTLIIVGVIVLYVSFQWLLSLLFSVLQYDPRIWAFYKSMEAIVLERSLPGLFYGSVLCSTFFSGVPVEAFVLYYLGLAFPWWIVMAVAMGGVLVGTLFNYLLGLVIGPRLVKWIVKEHYDSFHRKVERAGGFLIIIFNIIPVFPTDLFSLFLGTIRYNVFKLLFYSFIGRIIQFFLLLLAYKYLILSVGPYVSSWSLEWFIALIKSGFAP